MKYILLLLIITTKLFSIEPEAVNPINGLVEKDNKVDIRNAKSVKFDKIRGDYYEKFIKSPSEKLIFAPFKNKETSKYVDYKLQF